MNVSLGDFPSTVFDLEALMGFVFCCPRRAAR